MINEEIEQDLKRKTDELKEAESSSESLEKQNSDLDALLESKRKESVKLSNSLTLAQQLLDAF